MSNAPPPFRVPFLDKAGYVEPNAWQTFLLRQSTAVADSAPNNARFVVTTANPSLTNQINLGALTAGFLSITVALGIATPSSSPTIAASVLTGTLPALVGTALTALTGANVDHSVVAKAFADTGYVAANDQTVLADATGGATTIKLPAALVSGKSVTVKKIDASANAVTIDGNGHTIDGSATKAIVAQWNSRTMQTDGTNWFLTATV